MTAADLARADAALEWARRIADPEFDAWDAHLAWLEQDQGNAAAFDRALLLIEDGTRDLAAVDRGAAEAPASAVNDNHEQRVPRRFGPFAGMAAATAAVAAGLGALVALRPPGQDRATAVVFATQPGETRRIVLADGSSITLNGASRVRLEHANPRAARVEQGEAWFAVRHDAGRPFTVTAGTATFQDVGTAFDVRRSRDTVQIAVGEGAVLFDPGAAAVRLERGQAMTIADGTATVRTIDPAAAGAWRTGRLIYRDAPFDTVASDLARATGMPLAIDPALDARRFSGVIMIDRDPARMRARIGAVMRVAVLPNGDGWLLKRMPR